MDIDRQDIVTVLRDAPNAGVTAPDLARALGLSRDRRGALRAELLELVRLGQLVHMGRRFRLADSAEQPPARGAARGPSAGVERSGLLRVTMPGRGVVLLDELAGDQVWVDPPDLGGAMDGDTVVVELTRHGQRPKGQIVRVVQRGRRRLTGVLREPERDAPWRVEPDDPRLASLRVELVGAASSTLAAGQVVLAEVTRYPERVGEALGVVAARVLENPGSLPTEVARVLYEQGIGEAFPEAVIAEAAGVPDHVRPADLVDRVDLRDRPFITIDPETARDFDDAVTIDAHPGGGARVWVAVADVSHYVQPGASLDDEAQARGCSIYLPDRAIPMLPPALSSGICSLVPARDRLAMVARLDVDARGEVTDSAFMAAVLHSRARLDYEGVAAAFQGTLRGRLTHYREQLSQLGQLREVARRMRERRLRRGSLDLDLPESKVVLDEDDPLRVRDIRASHADAQVREAYNLIEELMLAANEAVGRYLRDRQVTAIWRVHEPPKTDALERLAQTLAAYSAACEPQLLATPRGMARLLRQLAAHPAGRWLNYLVLRSLKQASYQTINRGHFGLASECYLHFTSPIRRYPDIEVHRLLKRQLRAEGQPAGGRVAGQPERAKETLRRVAEQASSRERLAQDVSRQVHAIYAASLMRDRIGDEHWGRVSGLAAFGMFVELDEPRVDGLVKIESLPEAMRFDSASLRLFGRRSGRCISLGDPVRVRVVGASVTRRQIDLVLLEHQPSTGPVGALPSRGRRGASAERPRARRAGRKQRRQ